MKFLEDMLEKQYGIEIAQKIIEGYLAKRKTTLRINTIKSNIIQAVIQGLLHL